MRDALKIAMMISICCTRLPETQLDLHMIVTRDHAPKARILHYSSLGTMNRLNTYATFGSSKLGNAFNVIKVELPLSHMLPSTRRT